jgi:hypothetical protein
MARQPAWQTSDAQSIRFLASLGPSSRDVRVGLPTVKLSILMPVYLETCFKLMPAQPYRYLDIRETGFGMEAEFTGKLLRRGVRPYEIPINYKARTRAAGKKLTWRDGVQALRILLRERSAARRA